MARAGDDVEELGSRVDKVEDLGQEQEDERLAEMTLDADHDEDHAGKVAVGVSDKDVGGVFVVGKEGQAHTQQGQEEEETEQVTVNGRVRVRRDKVQTVVCNEEQGDDDGLHHLDAVDAREDVDGVWAKDGQSGHVDVVQPAQVDQLCA